jgi:hypothetical protein
MKMLGKTTSIKALTTLFYIGIVPILLQSILFGIIVSKNTTYDKNYSYISEAGERWYTSSQVDNIPLGVFLGIVSCIVLIIGWKIICELLIIIFKWIELSTKKNDLAIQNNKNEKH